MARQSPRLRDAANGHGANGTPKHYQIVFVEVDRELTCLLTARVADAWYYVEARTEAIRARKLKDEFNRLANRVLDEREGKQLPSESKPHTNGDGAAAGSAVSAGSQKTGDNRTSLSPAETDLAEFLLPCLTKTFDDADAAKSSTTTSKSSKPKTLQDWYAAPITCLSISASTSSSTLTADPRPDLDGETYLHKTITPHMTLPKPLRALPSVPWFSPADLAVHAESHDIHMPLHPTIVQPLTNGHTSESYFLKLATQDDSAAVERELKTLAKLTKLDLYAKGVRAPRLAGLVSLPSTPSAHSTILGFLLTLIPQPAHPLLSYMDEEVDSGRRHAWARAAARMVRTLHAADVIWGDAKGDNFVVDAHDALWIIDFGGSYTEGWVDREKAGTKRGDVQGLEKLMNGVRDPARYLAEAEEAERELDQEQHAGEKRAREEEAAAAAGGEAKKRKT